MKNFDLLPQLKKYKPFDETEKGYVTQTIDFLQNGKDQFVRTNLARHIVANAYLFNTNYSEILLTHHKVLGIWLPFGGHSDGESNSLNVALREAREESGIENINIGDGKIFDVDIHTIPNNPKKKEPEHKHIAISFVFTTLQTNFVISDESDALAWMPIDQFLDMLENAGYYSNGDRIAKKLEKYIKQEKTKSIKK